MTTRTARTKKPITVTLQTDGGARFAVRGGPKMQAMAMRWAYLARYRYRWSRNVDVEVRLAKQIRKDLKECGLAEDAIKELARAWLIQVAVPYATEEHGWEARVLPWEFVLGAATQSLRMTPLTVVRHLDIRGRRSRPRRIGVAPSGCFVETAPGGLRAHYSFDGELQIVSEVLGKSAVDMMIDPTLDELQARLKQTDPDILHLTGVDNHQAFELLGRDLPWQSKEGPDLRDGIPFRDPGKSVDFVQAESIGGMVRRSGAQPAFVACNMFNSAARTAPLIVAAGAGAAIGFQDTFDDEAAEAFFATFYSLWRQSSGLDLLGAFREAWAQVRSLKDLRGTGIVLWSDRTLIPSNDHRPSSRGTASALAATTPARSVPTPETDSSVPLDEQPDWQRVLVAVKHHPTVNYSLLHNGGGLFSVFQLIRLGRPVVRNVEITVELHVGSDSFPYRRLVSLDRIVTPLADDVRIPLTSALARRVSEDLRTSLYVAISAADHVIYRQTLPVSLLPVDEWSTSNGDGTWLPSFVFPRDPAVARVIDEAQRYLGALGDDPAAGFDGYQRADPDSNDFSSVDRQVQSIWWSLIYDVKASYINPPPTYSDVAQRLRSPTQVLEGRRGTCIDLALLLAGCMEYIGLYSVIFTFDQHAFAGFWRAPQQHDAFMGLLDIARRSDVPTGKEDRSAASKGQTPRKYLFLSDAVEEIKSEIAAGRLVPIEGVSLTARRGLAEAIEAGREHFQRPGDFRQMVDVELARRAGLTPLPLQDNR